MPPSRRIKCSRSSTFTILWNQLCPNVTNAWKAHFTKPKISSIVFHFVHTKRVSQYIPPQAQIAVFRARRKPRSRSHCPSPTQPSCHQGPCSPEVFGLDLAWRLDLTVFAGPRRRWPSLQLRWSHASRLRLPPFLFNEQPREKTWMPCSSTPSWTSQLSAAIRLFSSCCPCSAPDVFNYNIKK